MAHRESQCCVRVDLAEPDKMLEERDPIATALYEKYQKVPMPRLRLGEGDIAALIDYLATQTNVQDPVAANDPSTAAAASP